MEGNTLGQADLIVVGSGPAGLAAATAAARDGVRCLVIEREERPGGILKQCIHDGFGLIRFGSRLTGPEYAHRELGSALDAGVEFLLSTYITGIETVEGGFLVRGVNRSGVLEYRTAALVFATGCRERSGRQIFLSGERPAGVYTAGMAQYFINIQGYLPGRRCVILGSGDIGLIMARRLRLEGSEVEGVYEIEPRPSGLPRNIAQCLEDFGIPLHLSTTVVRVHGSRRLEGVTVAAVDQELRPLAGSERFIPCDTLLLSVGLIPENELAESLGIRMDPVTGGPVVDSGLMCSVPGIFSCGNALHVSDLADHVSATGETAGIRAAAWARNIRRAGSFCPGAAPALDPDPASLRGSTAISGEALLPLRAEPPVRYIIPQTICRDDLFSEKPLVLYFRVARSFESADLALFCSITPAVSLKPGFRGGGQRGEGQKEELLLSSKRYPYLRPAEMEMLKLDLPGEARQQLRQLLVAAEESGRMVSLEVRLLAGEGEA